MWLLVRVENTRPRHIRDMVVLDLVCPNLVTPDRPFLQRMFVAAYAPGTCLDAANSRRFSAFRLLAPWLLGMDWRGCHLRIRRRGSFPDVFAFSSSERSHSTSERLVLLLVIVLMLLTALSKPQ